MPVALDRRVAYYGTHLSENIARSPEGFIICKNAVIARTGFQTYRVSELADPEGLLSERNYRPDEEIQIWRDPKEVFSPATIASFEGKTFTLTHPDELLTPDNERIHSQGHIQNVRRGSEPLASGDIPLLADIFVTGHEAIRAIESGERELSCGYTYRLAREGYRWDQREIVGNHAALVQKGRAGAEARINDSAPERTERETRMKISSYLKHLVGEGFKAFAKDASPEELTDALRDPQISTALEAGLDGKKPETIVSIAADRAAAAPAAPKMEYVGTTKDGIKIFKEVGGDNAAPVDDNDAKNKRQQLHAELDKVLNKAGSHVAMDDLKNFAAQMDKFMEGEAHDDKHPEDCRCADCMDKRKAKDNESEEEAEEENKETEHEAAEEDAEQEEEDAEIVRAEPVLEAGQRPEGALKVVDAKMLRRVIADSNLSMLNMLKPFVAKSKDKTLINAFDTATKKFKSILKDNAGKGPSSYASFMKFASTLSAAARDSKDTVWTAHVSDKEKEITNADKMYAEVLSARRKPFAAPN